jgi:uncharacterized membrane protein YhaH (DUF805 family)
MWNQFRLIVSRHYFDLHGRVCRADFWFFVLACLLVYGAAFCAAFALGEIAHRLRPLMNCILTLTALALLPPLAGMGARRLRDIGQDAWLVATLIVPLAVHQVTGLLAAEPFLRPGFIYFFGTYGGEVDFVALVAAVALTSFWMQPDAVQADTPPVVPAD